jgi:hypothetical protein
LVWKTGTWLFTFTSLSPLSWRPQHDRDLKWIYFARPLYIDRILFPLSIPLPPHINPTTELAAQHESEIPSDVYREPTLPLPPQMARTIQTAHKSKIPEASIDQPEQDHHPVLTPAAPKPSSSTLVQASARKKRRRRKSTYPWAPKRKPEKKISPPPTHCICRICAEEKPFEEFVEYKSPDIPSQCRKHLAHDPSAKNKQLLCRSCIGQAMVARHDLVGARKLSYGCFEPGCQTFWDLHYILHFFPTGKPLERYNADLLKIFLIDSGAITCPKCAVQGLPNDKAPGYPLVQCHSSTCKTRFCAFCSASHAGLTCAEYAVHPTKLTNEDMETLKTIQRLGAKRCPKCHCYIEKDGGCDHVYCTACKHQFSWSSSIPSLMPTYGSVQKPILDSYPRDPSCEMDALQDSKH